MQAAVSVVSRRAEGADRAIRAERNGAASSSNRTAQVLNLEPARQRKVVAQYAPVVERLVQRAMAKVGFFCEEDEIRSAAYVGLLEATRRYDGTRGIPFEAFAQHRIQGAILDELRSRDSLNRLSRQRARAVEQTRERLVRKLHREPTEQELARGSGEDLETFRTRGARERAQAQVSLEELSAHDWEEVVPSEQASALEALCDEELRHQLLATLEQLPERLRFIVTAYYRENLSYREIGQALGVTESRVCQLLKGLHRSLREQLAAHAA